MTEARDVVTAHRLVPGGYVLEMSHIDSVNEGCITLIDVRTQWRQEFFEREDAFIYDFLRALVHEE